MGRTLSESTAETRNFQYGGNTGSGNRQAALCQHRQYSVGEDKTILQCETSDGESRMAFLAQAGKQVYNYQFLGIYLGTGDAGLCYDLERYDKEDRTKVQMSKDILRSLLETEEKVIVMMDYRYTIADLYTSAKKETFP